MVSNGFNGMGKSFAISKYEWVTKNLSGVGVSRWVDRPIFLTNTVWVLKIHNWQSKTRGMMGFREKR